MVDQAKGMRLNPKPVVRAVVGGHGAIKAAEEIRCVFDDI